MSDEPRAGRARETPPIRLTARRIYILPTRYGLVFFGMLAAMVLGAANYQNNLAFLLAFLLAGMALVSLLHTHRNLNGVTVTGITAAPVFAGRRARYRILLDAGEPPRSAIRVSLDGTGVLADLPAGRETAVEVARPTTRRGVQRPVRLTLSTRHPLGLFRAWAVATPEAACLVYPRPFASALPMTAGGRSDGARAGTRPGAEDFQGLAAYQPGDLPQHIHWKGFARGQGVFTKRFADPAGGGGLFDWFVVPEADPEKKIGMLCHAVLEAERRKTAYGLRLPGRLIPAASGHRQRHRCLEALARMPVPA